MPTSACQRDQRTIRAGARARGTCLKPRRFRLRGNLQGFVLPALCTKPSSNPAQPPTVRVASRTLANSKIQQILVRQGFAANKNATPQDGACKFGAAGGDRTHDPWLRRPILYPLSYSRTQVQLSHALSLSPALARWVKGGPL